MPAAPRYWGYHRLADVWAYRLVAGAGIRPGELVLDVGAGAGAITHHLVTAGARVIALETYPDRARRLRSRFSDQPVKVIAADGADLWLPRQAFRVVANPPFGITTALLRRLLHPSSRLVSADIVVPAPVGARWAGGRGPGTRRSAQSYTARVVTHLPSDAFRPPAPLRTVVLRVDRHPLGGHGPNAPPPLGRRERKDAGSGPRAPPSEWPQEMTFPAGSSKTSVR